MECRDGSAYACDAIVCQSGGFGFFQKRLFLIATLIQSACVSVLLYTCTCMPGVEDVDDVCSSISSSQQSTMASYENSDSNITSTFTNITDSSNSSQAYNLINDILFNATHTLATLSPSTTLSHLQTGVNNLAALNKASSQSSLENSSIGNIAANISASSLFRNMFDVPNSTSFLYSDASSIYHSDAKSSTPSKLPPETALSILPSFLTTPPTATAPLQRLNHRDTPTVIEPTNVYSTEHSSSHHRRVHARSVRHELESDKYSTRGSALPPTQISQFAKNSSREIETYLTNFAREVSEMYHNLSTSLFLGLLNSSLMQVEASNSSLYDDTNSKYNNSPPDCGWLTFFLRTNLPKSQILFQLDIADLVHVMFYTQGAAMMVGAGVGGMAADIYGRRRILFMSLAAMFASHTVSALSISWFMFVVLRAAAVFSAGATMVISFVLVIEFIGPDCRDACTLSCFWVLGSILISLLTLITHHWRWLALMSGGICLPLLGAFFTSTESVRWLQSQHKFQEAECGFREVASVNSATVPDMMALLDRARTCVATNMHVKRHTYLDLFNTFQSARWTFALIYTCTMTACVYGCLLGRVRQITDISAIDGFLPFLIDLPLTWSVIVVNRCLGRRWCLFLYSAASSFSLLSVLVLHATGNVAHMPSLVTGLSIFGKVGVTASLSLIFLLAIEMYPTVTRCMGLAVAVISASGGILMSEALEFLYQYHYTVPFLVFGVTMASVGAVALVFPETIHRPLRNVQRCRHRKLPLQEGARLVGSAAHHWDHY